MTKITIGVPVYNAEKVISKGLDSFVNQTMDKDDFEVILVDDCSTDDSLSLIKKYQGKLNMKIIELPYNSGGPGEPRNKIIDEASGKYILFVDSDDYIHHEALDKMYKFAEDNYSDVVLVKMKGINGRGVPMSMFKETQKNADLINSRIIYTLSPVKLFKTALLRNNDIYFPLGLKSAEDQIFTMKAYLNADVISILADQDYYYVVSHDGPHMSTAYVTPKEFYKVMSEIVDEIYKTKMPKEKKEELASVFLNRHFQFSRTKNFSNKIEDEEEKLNWIKELGQFLNNHVPNSVDKLTLPDVMARIVLARNMDLENYSRFELELKKGEISGEIIGDKVYSSLPYLSDYSSLKKLDVTELNKLDHQLKNVNVKSDSIVFTCTVKHSMLSSKLNEAQEAKAVFVHRQKKEEKFIFPAIVQPLTNNYTFEVPYEALIFDKKDIGTWDLFIESAIGDYKLRGRVGNKREAYNYKPETSYIGRTQSFNYRLTPYFTKPYDNFSLYVKELEKFEWTSEVFLDKKNKAVKLAFPNNYIILPSNSELQIKANNSQITNNSAVFSCRISETGTEVLSLSNDLNIREVNKLTSFAINGIDLTCSRIIRH